MKLSIKLTIVPFLLISFLLIPFLSLAQYQYEITPSISLSELYDDNINLTNRNEESDYITSASPGLNFTALSELSNFSLQYTPTFVWYDKNDQNDTVRQSAALTFEQDLADNLRFGLTDDYIRSEDPVEETEGVESIRETRNVYWRNTGRASLHYRFGRENTLEIGYNHSILENEDTTLDDGTTGNPFANMTYWFNMKNGLELEYEYINAEFSRDDGTVAGDDYDGHTPGLRYIYRFTPHTAGSIGYDYATRDFEGLTEDYKVHDGSIGFDHTFSPDLSLAASAGYFIQENDRTDDEKGYSYNASLNKSFDRGSITFGGSGGWSEDYLEAQRQGFTKYQGMEIGYQYRIMENLNNYANGSYRQNKESDNSEWKNIRVNYGLTWSFMRWYSLSMNYTYSVRDDDDNTEDYNDNRVMLIFSASKLFRK